MSEVVWTDRRVLVTGATGLLGGWLAQALVSLGADVVCLVRDELPTSRFNADRIANSVTVVRGDVCDGDLLERVLGEYEISVVFHLAAQTIVTIANRNPLATFETNIAGTWRLLEACRRSPLIEAVIVASSDKAYGDQLLLPYTEQTALEGRHPYDVSKSCADLIAQSYATTWGLPVAVTRCGNFFGGGDLNFNRIVPGTIRDVIRGRAPVIRSDGTLLRDYLYAEDGASAYVHVAAALLADPDRVGPAYNFSLERPMTVRQMVDAIIEVMEVSFEPVILGEVTNEIREQFLDSSLARQELDWEPEVGLEEGLRRTVDWYRNHFKGRR